MKDSGFIYERITVGRFRDAFRRMDRHHGYTYEGLGALFDYLEELADSSGEPMELCVISLCTTYTEHPTIESVAWDYGVERDPDWDDDEFIAAVRDEVEESGYLWQFPGGWMVEA